MDCGRDWQPTRLTHALEALRTSTRPLLVATDAGDAIVKAMGNPAGPEALAFELIGTELARWLGLNTPDFALLNLHGVPAEWSQYCIVEDGPAFLSRFMKSVPYAGDPTFLRKLFRPDDLARLVVLDTWIRNEDRCPPGGAAAPRPSNLDNLMFVRNRTSRRMHYDLIVFDHTHAFSSAGYEDLGYPSHIEDEAIYGFFPLFRPYMTRQAINSATARLRTIDETEVQALLDAVPTAWDLTVPLKRAWRDLICERARFVADTIEAKIIYQLELWEGGNDVGQ